MALHLLKLNLVHFIEALQYTVMWIETGRKGARYHNCEACLRAKKELSKIKKECL